MSYNKYGNRKVDLDGYTFDSVAEARRYAQLKLMQDADYIAHLEVHPRYEIIPAFKVGERKIRATFYEADFSYTEKPYHTHPIVEDVKGHQTEAFRLKRKLFELKYPGIEFRLVEA